MRFKKFAAVLLAALLMLTLFAIPAFAEETSSATDSSAVVDSSATDSSAIDSSAVESSATDSSATGSSANNGSTTTTETKKINWDALVTGGVVLVALLVLVVIYFVSPKFKEKVNRFFKDYSSELKKVVWSPARDVKKNTIIVLVISAFFAIMIGVLDVIFSRGILSLDTFVEYVKTWLS